MNHFLLATSSATGKEAPPSSTAVFSTLATATVFPFLPLHLLEESPNFLIPIRLEYRLGDGRSPEQLEAPWKGVLLERGRGDKGEELTGLVRPNPISVSLKGVG